MTAQDLDSYVVVAVAPRELRVCHRVLDFVSSSGTRYHRSVAYWTFRTWDDLLNRRKPFAQPGPVFVYNVPL